MGVTPLALPRPRMLRRLHVCLKTALLRLDPLKTRELIVFKRAIRRADVPTLLEILRSHVQHPGPTITIGIAYLDSRATTVASLVYGSILVGLYLRPRSCQDG